MGIELAASHGLEQLALGERLTEQKTFEDSKLHVSVRVPFLFVP